MQRAGHRRFETTQIYVREAESLREGFGDVFPPLPPDLLEPTKEFRSGSGLSTETRPILLGQFRQISGGADGTRTRGLRRDRPAL